MASSYPEIPDVILSSIHTMVSLRLDSTNYFPWSHLMTTIFNAYNLRGYIDGTITAPDESSPDFSLWSMYDSRVMCLLHATMTESAMSYILHTHTACEMWEVLKERFTSMSEYNIMIYRSHLQTISKGDDSVSVYVERIERIVHKLCGFERRPNDAEIIEHALRGLPEEYAAFRNSVKAREEPLYTNQFYVMLLAEEASILAGNNQH